MIWNKLRIAFKIKLLVLAMVLVVFILLSYASYLIFRKALIAENTREMVLMNQYREEQVMEAMLEAEAVAKDVIKLVQDSLHASDFQFLDYVVHPSKSMLLEPMGIHLVDSTGHTLYRSASISDSFLVAGGSKPPVNTFFTLLPFVLESDKLMLPIQLILPAGYTGIILMNASRASNNWIKKSKENPEAQHAFYLLAPDGAMMMLQPEGVQIIRPDQRGENAFYTSVFSKESGSGILTMSGQSFTASWNYVSGFNGGFFACTPLEVVLEPLSELLSIFLAGGLAVLLFSYFATSIFSNLLVKPLTHLKSKLGLIGQGVLPEHILVNSADEVGEMTQTVNQLVEGLKRTAVFANKIGRGNFDATFTPLSEQDTLGKALLEMRNSLQDAELRDAERNWIVNGIAEIGQILRNHSTLDLLGDEVVSYLCGRIEAVQGALYLSEDQEGRSVLRLNACFAYNRKKHHKQVVRFGEGLAGQAAIERATVFRLEIPRDYVTITSGLIDEQRPNSILIVPLVSNDEVFGVLEFASFVKIGAREIRFIEETAEIIARTVFNITVNERTRKLLEASQQLAADLQERQEELRRNALEMEHTQQQLRTSNTQLEEQVEEVSRTQKRMQVLLQNASEVITIYEADATIRYVSPSVESILGYKSDDLIGKSDIEHFHTKGAEDFRAMFEHLLDFPQEQVTIQFSYQRKNGDQIWLEATGKNMLADTAIRGIVVNTRDITERRRAEKEARMRGQMQALSENSPDIITRLSKDRQFFYINPVIETYTGLPSETFLQKKLSEVHLQNGVVDAWDQIIERVVAQQSKLNTEIDFPSELGKRVFNVNAIPEFGDNNNLESVLLVLHDITSRKLIELDIQSKNKKITESINYAKRIQGAILPDNRSIKRVLKDSFILYKPKDVVSGDFPWFMQKGDDLYIAAVDCTGHGVPGALISLIGYFLLNDIVGGEKMRNPGGILTLLDEKVTKTLRQDTEDSQTRDGMDVAFCKINLKRRKLEYAGAHRPLYMIKQGVLHEFKGDKFPIGGAQYKTRTEFTNHEVDIEEGDRIFFCSDGFPDQFNAENKKFSPRRIRELIEQNKDIPVYEMYQVMDKEFEQWKGDVKQLDDVLMIGIGF